MGILLYSAAHTALKIDDLVMSHLKVVTTSKLRRHEGFLLSWVEPENSSFGRGSVWIHPNADLVFEFDERTAPALDRHVLDEMSRGTSATTGLHIEAARAR